jgi:nitrogen fixation protein NifU and related proteins
VTALATLYQDAIRRHASKPVGYRVAIDATHRHELHNPQCGDRIEIRFRVVRDEIAAAAFDGEACAICMASASLLCETSTAQPVVHLLGLHARLTAALEGSDELDGAETLKPLLGVRPYPSRIRCATLPWEAARNAL